jgi:hypothetical protein
MSIALNEIQSSDLSRNPLRVFAAAEIGPVLLTRRDGSNFVLRTESSDASRSTLVEFAGRFFAAANDTSPDSQVTKLARQFPWMMALSPENREICVRELNEAATAAFATGQSFMFEVTLNAWYDTAQAMAAGLQVGIQEEPHEEPIKVARP